MKNQTLDFYNEHARQFFNETLLLDLFSIYGEFLTFLKPHAHILDAGCGSGRDSLYFLGQGYNVTSFDGAECLVELSSSMLHREVLNMTFEDFSFKTKFDGIWANASLIHVYREDIVSVMRDLTKTLYPKGVFYMSFKYGVGDYLAPDGRYFNCYCEDDLQHLVLSVGKLRILKIFKTPDFREGREKDKWIHCIAKLV